MDRSALLKALSSVEGFEQPSIELEQYMTPPELAADMVWTAQMQGDLEGKVIDLGAGTGILGIGAALLGAEVTLVEKDGDALEKARESAEALDAEVETLETDVSELETGFDTALMNPPFSVHSDEFESFLEASKAAESVYTLCNAGDDRAESFFRSAGFEVAEVENYMIELPATYGFHTEEGRSTEVKILVATRV